MQPLTFPCPTCGKLMGVAMESAGRSVRCPHCQQVVTAPAVAPIPAFSPHEELESALDDTSESLFGSSIVRRPDSMLTDEVAITPHRPEEPPPTEPVIEPTIQHRSERRGGSLPVKEIALGVVTVYALVMTLVAILGWTRQPAANPPPVPVKAKK